MSVIEVKDLSFSYDQQTMAVENVSFNIEQGSYTTIVGHNGSGKSTVAKLMAGLLEKNSGTILIDGMELNEENIRKIRKRIGIVFQNPDNQFIGATVRDDIAFGLENHCVPQGDMDEIIDTFAAKVGMTDYLNSEPTRLSGGQKQRVAIAGVLAMQPDILIFDEATSMLDPQGKQEIKNVMMELHKESNLTLVSITHDIEEVCASDYVIAMHEGHIAKSGNPEELFKDEKTLNEIQLDLPFSLKFKKEMAKNGVSLKEDLSLEGMVKELCQLHSNM